MQTWIGLLASIRSGPLDKLSLAVANAPHHVLVATAFRVTCILQCVTLARRFALPLRGTTAILRTTDFSEMRGSPPADAA
jgi:hypothetical protein